MAHKQEDGSLTTLPGVRGISLFIVPKRRVNDDGSLGESNGVSLAGLNHKMGYRGTTNCVMSYGEGEGECVGELLGEVGQGLATMFLMMNEARIAIGYGACALGHAGYIRSRDYARERRQGRLPTDRNPSSQQVPIMQHADVRRMLLVQKCYVEGGLSLAMFGSLLVDLTHDLASAGDTPTVQTETERRVLLDVLTPVIKSWPSEWCLEANKWAIQIQGGYGYTRDYDVEQIYRDNRLNMIHEGTNGIQSLDLLGRKMTANKGQGLAIVVDEIRRSAVRACEMATLGGPHMDSVVEHGNQLMEATERLKQTAEVLTTAGATGRPDLMMCNSHEFLNMTGTILIAWRWLEMEAAAVRCLGGVKAATKEEDAIGADGSVALAAREFYDSKLLCAKYFFKHELPKTVQQAQLLQSLDDLNLIVQDEHF